MIVHKQLRKLDFTREHDGWVQCFFKEERMIKIELIEDLDSDNFEIYIINGMSHCFIGKTSKITDITRIVRALEPLK